VLEIETAAGTISGQLAIEDAPARSFYGWLELIDRLERATNRGETASDSDAERRRPP
jgi:hypothetical protein